MKSLLLSVLTKFYWLWLLIANSPRLILCTDRITTTSTAFP
jgi:hypothetical protein